jgi:hypothetical protein
MKHYVIKRKSDNQYAFRGTYREKHEGFEVFCSYDPEIQWARNNDSVELIEVEIIIKH